MLTNNIMIDIETFSLKPTSAIIQIAAIRFDSETKEIIETFDNSVHIPEKYRKNFDYDINTFRWWFDDKDRLEILLNLKKREELINDVLNKFSDFVKKDDYIWAHEAFDVNRIEYAYHVIGKSVPWNFRNIRGIRTLVDLSGIDLTTYDWSLKTHDALDDCKFQIDYVCDALDILNNNHPY